MNKDDIFKISKNYALEYNEKIWNELDYFIEDCDYSDYFYRHSLSFDQDNHRYVIKLVIEGFNASRVANIFHLLLRTIDYDYENAFYVRETSCVRELYPERTDYHLFASNEKENNGLLLHVIFLKRAEDM